MADPPLLAGAVQLTRDWALALEVATTVVGAPGTVEGVAAAVEGRLVPAALVAVTVNVYAVPAVSPEVTVHEVPAVVQVAPPGDAVTV